MNLKIGILRAVFTLLDACSFECKTIGNLHPTDMHCLTCSLYALRGSVKTHLDFWSEEVTAPAGDWKQTNGVLLPKTVQRWERPSS